MKAFEFFLLILTLLCFESKTQILRILDDEDSDLLDTDGLTETNDELDTDNISSDLIEASDSIDPSSNPIFTISDSIESLDKISNNSDISLISPDTTEDNIDINYTNATSSDSSESSYNDTTLETELETDNISDSSNENNGNNTNIIPSTLIRPKLILVGFGNVYRAFSQTLIFKVFFFRILGGMPSKDLTFTININYWRRLRLLEEVKANCTRITDDSNDNIEYNCTAPINGNRNSYSISTQGNDLRFGNGESTDVTFSSIANQTKNNINRQTGSDLQNTIVLNGTILDQDDKTFTLTGNVTEDINDKEVTLYLNEMTNYVTCSVNKIENKMYELECTPNQSIKANLEGIMGRTSSGKYILIHFADETDDLLEIEVNNNNNNNNNNNIVNNAIYARKSSSSKISKGVLIGIIIAAVVILIIIGIVIAMLCRSSTKPLVQETIMEIYPNQSVKQNQNINGYQNYY